MINLTKPSSYIADIQLFGYEISTALLCRILQLSIPSQHAAQLLSLSSAIVEMGTRVFFYNLFLKAGMKAGDMDKQQQQHYKRRGFMRVQDGSNDMVVEYVSSIAATLILVWLAPTGAFDFSGQAVDSKQVLAVSFFQLAPELVLDFYCTFIEVYGGLASLHTDYWTVRGIKGGNYTDGESYSNFQKANVTKLFFVGVIILIVLLASLK